MSVQLFKERKMKMSNTVINTNVLALNSHRNLGKVGTAQRKASQRLSSGLRINSAADDAAGLAISEKMRAQIRGLDQASKNAQDAQSLIQTAEGGLQEIDNMVQRIRELVVQASNDTNDQEVDPADLKAQGDRQKIQDEINALVEEIDAMADRVQFNNKTLLDGTYAGATEAVDAADPDYTAITAPDFTDLKSTTAGTGLGALVTAFDGEKTETNWNAIKSEIAGYTAGTDGATQEMLDAANAAIEAAEVAAGKVEAQDATEGKDLYFQIGANAGQGIKLNIQSVKSDTLGIGDGTGKATLDVVKATGDEINGYLDTLDSALTKVTTERSKLGAVENRLEYAKNSLDISSENLSASESRIRDADMAKEMMNLVQANVLQQAATAMLAQANQAPQSVLQLLQ